MAGWMAFDVQQGLWLLLIAGAGIGVAVVVWGMARLVSGMASKTQGSLDDKLVKALRPPLAAFSGVLASVAALVVLQGRLDPGLVDQSRRVLVAIFLVLGMWGLIRVVRAVLERAGRRHVRFQPAAHVGGRLVSLFLYTIAFLMVLSVYGISITPILTGLGIAGLAVALALQDTGANFFAGIWIQTGKALQPGHFVRLEQEKLEGYVEEVGWRVTRIRTLARNTVIVPNNKLAQAVTTDYYLPDPQMSIGIRFRVAFEADPDLVMRVLVEEAKEAMKEHDGIVGEPFAALADIADDCNVFEVTVRVTEFVQQYRAQQVIRLRVLRRFYAEKIRIPYPTKHNLQEPVAAPTAKRKADAPEGFAPGRRPPRPGAKNPKPPVDPRLAEAENAKKDIEAAQREKAAEEGETVPVAAVAATAATGAAAMAQAAGSDGKAPAAGSGKGGAEAAAAAAPDKPAADKPAATGEGKDGSDGGEKPANPLTRTG